jgi:hypothetical protein
VTYLHRRKGAECDFFRGICEQGHYGGRTKPTNTRQGIYCATPSGRLLASVNTTDPRRMEQMLDEAWKKWQAMPKDERYATPAPEATKARPKRCPTDGLVLRAYVRDLPRKEKIKGWRGAAWNTDTVWFRNAEARAWLPESLKVGAEREVPVRRLTRFAIVDSVRGQTRSFSENQIVDSTVTSRITAVEDSLVRVELVGKSHAETENRGVRVRLKGRATYDTSKDRFVKFELVGFGTRWGTTEYNARQDDRKPSPIGYAFVLAPEGDTVEPAFWWAYWR